MPNYVYECKDCGDFELWQSMKDTALTSCVTCGKGVKKVLGPVRTHGVGAHGAKTQEVDARENRWHKDMPAYKRLRDKGLQPPQIDGCDRLEATAKNIMEINSGGRLKIDEKIVDEKRALADDIMSGRT